MTLQEKLNLVTNYFAEDWAIEKAMQLLEDYDKAQQPAASAAPNRICNTCQGTGIVKGLHNWIGGGTREEKCWSCHEAPQPSPTPQADSQPAAVREEEREAFKAAHRHLELDEVPDAWGRPTFKHSHVEASWLGWIARAARTPADSVTAPAGGVVAEVVMANRPPKASPAWLPHKIIHASLQWLDSVPVGTKLYTTPPAQSSGSVLEDAARYRWLRTNAIGAFRTNNGNGPVSVYHLSKIPALPGIPEETDAAIDAAMNKGCAA